MSMSSLSKIHSLNFDSMARDKGLIERMKTNTARYVQLFSQAIDQIMPPAMVNFMEDDLSTFEITMAQRKANF